MTAAWVDKPPSRKSAVLANKFRRLERMDESDLSACVLKQYAQLQQAQLWTGRHRVLFRYCGAWKHVAPFRPLLLEPAVIYVMWE